MFNIHVLNIASIHPGEDWVSCTLDIYHSQTVFKLTKISMVPLEILVVIPRAWKKEVFSGPRPVFWAGTVTSQGAIAPARAAAGTLSGERQQSDTLC